MQTKRRGSRPGRAGQVEVYEREVGSMYIGVGTIVLILIIVLLIAFVF
jgi:hypothetical protein